MARKPLVSIIVPAKNSALNLRNFLSSCTRSTYKPFEVIINDDNSTSDDTPAVVNQFKRKLTVIYKRENVSMAQGRKRGVEFAKGEIYLHLDSDMELTPGLLYECAQKLTTGGYDALIIPEDSFGTTFWAKCKWLEKKCYEGVEQIESLRCVKAGIYTKVDGHNSNMVFSEDKDLDIRIRATGAKVGRTINHLRHNEGSLRLLASLRKKGGYTKTASQFSKQHPSHYAWQINIFNRYLLYLRSIDLALVHPILYIGMIYMKTAEFAAGGFFLLQHRLSRQNSKGSH